LNANTASNTARSTEQREGIDTQEVRRGEYQNEGADASLTTGQRNLDARPAAARRQADASPRASCGAPVF
jgi:hypothetical protein